MLSLRLEHDLHFAPMQIGLVYASSALGAILASLVAGQVADRWLSAERCIAVCSTVAGGLLWAVSYATDFPMVCVLCLGVWLFMVPVMILGVTTSLAHLERPELQFSRVRLWGTIGWMGAGLFFGLWLHQAKNYLPVSLDDSPRLGGILAFVLAGYALTLPHTPPSREAKTWLAPLQAIHLLRNRNFAVFCICGFIIHMTITFQLQMTSLMLKRLGLAEAWISPILTVGQCSEVVILFLLPVLSGRLGMKGTLLLGISAMATVLTVLMIGEPLWLMISILLLNGFVICCYVIRGQVFINSQARKDIRASAQGLFTTINGIGLLLGNLLCGVIRNLFEGQFAPTFAVGAGIALFGVFLLAFGFRSEPATSTIRPQTTPEEPTPSGIVELPKPIIANVETTAQPLEV